MVLETCDSNFDTTLTHSVDGSHHTVDDSGPCETRAVLAQTFSSGSHTISIGMYSSGGNYRIRYWCGILNTNCESVCICRRRSIATDFGALDP